jgi:hypothetical protein
VYNYYHIKWFTRLIKWSYQYIKHFSCHLLQVNRIFRKNNVMSPYPFVAVMAIFIITINRVATKTPNSDTDNTTTTLLFCSYKKAGLLLLCTQCYYSTKLPSYVFPRYLTEVVCMKTKKGDNEGCLIGDGSCLQKIMSVNFQRQNQGDGRWEDYIQEIRTGCECGVSSDSIFKQFVNYNRHWKLKKIWYKNFHGNQQ